MLGNCNVAPVAVLQSQPQERHALVFHEGHSTAAVHVQ